MGADIGKFFMNLIDPGRSFSTITKMATGRSVESYFGSSFDKKEKPAAAPATADTIGNLTEEEAAASVSKRAFREGLYFTSPTGTYGSGSRGRSRLMAA